MRGRSRGLEAAIVGLAFCLVAAVGVAYGARGWGPPLASRHGAGIDAMLRYLLVTVGTLFAAGHLVLGYLVWRGGSREHVALRLRGRRSERLVSVGLGLLMALVAEGGVLAIGLPVWGEYFAAEPPPDAIAVEVTAQQFVWNVRYPGADGRYGRTDPHLIDADNPIGLDPADPAAADDIVLINELALPEGRPAAVTLRSRDVIHSFFLPHLRVKQDAVPGMAIRITFVPTRKGTYEIACTELCGLGHYRMRGFLYVLPPPEYEAWLRARAPMAAAVGDAAG